jgi:hypothetical protein
LEAPGMKRRERCKNTLINVLIYEFSQQRLCICKIALSSTFLPPSRFCLAHLGLPLN